MQKSIQIILAFCLLTSIISCKQRPTIIAEITGLGDDIIYASRLLISDLDDETKDTIIAKNGRFIYDITIQKPILLVFYPKKAGFERKDGSYYFPESKQILLALGPHEKVRIKGKIMPFSLEYKTKGNKFNENYCRFVKQFHTIYKKIIPIEMKIDSLYFSEEDQQLVSQLFKERNSYFQKIAEIKLEYIKNNPDKDLSAFFLALGQPLDTLGKYVDMLDMKVKNGIFRDLIKYKMLEYQKYVLVRQAEKRIIPGNKAPNFTLTTINDTDFSLSEFKGKYVVLDFWGSWCGPCIYGLPKMKEYYEKYKSKVVFVSIACNDKIDNWKKAVKKYELNWIQLINNNTIEKDVSVMYAVKAYPTKIIIDKEGKIIQKFRGEGEDFYLKIDEILN